MSRLAPIAPRRIWQAAGAVALVAVAFAQNGGLIAPDTKLDLVLDPAGFLRRALSAWDPQAALGQVQNQAYGYLWPMGPFFAGGHAAGLPPWVIERLWWSLLFLLAYTGMLKLQALWSIGTANTRIIGALAFALSPRVLSVMGTVSSEAWPLALLPWILVPLVRGARAGDPRRAALWSAVAVGCLGAVNAVASLAVLIPAVLYLLTRAAGPRRRALIGWWLLGVVLACTWWMVPLLIQSRVAPPFLSAIESASVTTTPTSLVNVLRGTSHWLAFTGGGGSGAPWYAGSWLAANPWAVIGTAAVAALGIGGLAGRLGGERRFLTLSALIGIVAVAIGYAGSVGSPWAAAVQHALDGPLAPLRNVHKADPLLRLPLAVGLTSALAALPRLLRPVADRMLEPRHADRGPRYARGLAAVLVVPVLLVATLPALQGWIAPPGSFESVPDTWTQAAAAVAGDDPAGSGTALLVPSSNFGAYTWGRPLDEPMQALARSRWAVRNAIPLGAPGATRWLDAVQATLNEGVRSESLAEALRTAGVDRLILRNDLDPLTGVPSSAAARATLIASPGFRRVAAFGSDGTTGVLGSTGLAPLPALEVFEVSGTVVDAAVLADPPTAVGGPEAAVSPLAGIPSVMWGDRLGQPADVLTDTYRLRSQNYGAERGSDLTPTLDASADFLRGRPSGDISPWGADVPRSQLAAPPSTTASSSTADPFGVRYEGPATAPVAAADGDPSTAWVSAPGDPAPWWQRTFPRRPVGQVTVHVSREIDRARVETISVEAGGRTVTAAVPNDGVVRVNLGGVDSDHVRVGLVARSAEPVSLIEVSIVGLSPVVPVVAVPGSAPAALLQAAPSGPRACLRSRSDLVTCTAGSARQGEDDAGWSRSVELSSSAPVTRVTVAARATASVGAAVDRARGITVTAPRTWIADPLARPGAALDGDSATAWLTSPGDLSPELTVTYPAPTTLTGVGVVTPAADRERPFRAVVTSENGSRTVELRPGRPSSFAALSGTSFRVVVELRPPSDPGGREPLQIEELALLGAPAPTASSPITIACGQGPSLTLGSTTVPLSITARVADVESGAPVEAHVCSPTASRGSTVMTAHSTADWRVVSVNLGTAPSSPSVGVTTLDRSDESARWTVGAGAAGRVLATTWGFNPGWSATLDGQALQAIRIDGWRQGWVLPATSSGGTVDAVFGAGRWQRAGLGVGALAALLLFVMAMRRPRPVSSPAVGPRAGGGWWVGTLAVVVPVALGGVVGLVATVVVGVISRGGRRARLTAGMGAVTLAVAGVLVAVTSSPSWGSGAISGVAQALCLVTVAALAWLSAGVRASAPQGGQLDDAPTHFSHGVAEDEAERSKHQ